MSAERLPKSVHKPEVPKTPATEPLVSRQTASAAEPVISRLADGKIPEKAEIDSLVSHIAQDLKAQGISLSSDDIRAIQARAQQGLSVSDVSAEHRTKAPVPLHELPEINLNEYKSVIDEFAYNYGLNKGAWNQISGILTASDIAGQLLSGFSRKIFTTGEGWMKLTKVFGDEISHSMLHLDTKKPGEFWNELKSWSKEDWKKTGGTVARKAFLAAWPIVATPAYWFLDRKGKQMAGKMFMTERARLQEQVNSRIADSLYMRNFEFLHDQSAAEMLEIINRGKDASIDLMSAIYEELIPLKRMQWISSLAQGIVNPWDMGTAVFKKLLLDTRIKPNARRIQQQRKDELEQWDKVNTKLMSTLQGLETVRTAGNAEAGSDVMYGALAERDFVEAGGLREKRMQDRAINKLFDFLDIGVPVITEGAGIAAMVKEGKFRWKSEGVEHIEDLTTEKLFYQMIQAGFRVSGSKAEQEMLRQSFLQLTHLYVDRIIPDIQDIKRMEELLGPYLLLDHPMGLRERSRIPAANLKNYDISVRDLRFKNILRGVNLDIPHGSFVTIKGPSGIGKSTLFRHLVGLYDGEGGSVSYGGTPIDRIKKYGDSSLYTKIAYANQSPQYFEDMTLRDNLLLWSRKAIPDGRVREVLQDLNLSHIIDRLDTKTKHFSGGEMRRIGIARALLKDPKVLFLDEPTANLDVVSSAQVMDIIQKLRKKRPDMTVVAITHDPVFEKIAEKIVDFEKINPKVRTDITDHQVLTASARPVTK